MVVTMIANALQLSCSTISYRAKQKKEI